MTYYFHYFHHYYYYLFFFFILLIFLFFAYLRIRFKFWAMQPVFHIYDLGYLFFPPGIIDHHLPEKNKYTNFKQIETIPYDQLSEYKSNQFIQFLQQHYLKKGDNVFSPKTINVSPYFTSHTSKCFVSFYTNSQLVTDLKKGTIEDLPQLVGVLTSRPVHISIWKNGLKNVMDVYYVDHLCVHRSYRKKGIAPEIIQTHHYHQRHANKNIVVSLFKREGELTGIVPLCAYQTYGFSVKKWVKPPEFPPAHYQLLEINEQNFSFLYDFLKNTVEKYFDISIHSEIGNLMELLKTENLFIYVLMNQAQEIQGAYFFKKSCVFVEKDLEVLTCVGSINDTVDEKLFVHGFKLSFWKIAEKHRFGFAAIENISHNHIFIYHLMKKTKPSVISPTAYFFYNFAYPTFSSNKAWILM